MMLLAYDATTGKIWTLEGNWGNYVVVKERAVDASLEDRPAAERRAVRLTAAWLAEEARRVRSAPGLSL